MGGEIFRKRPDRPWGLPTLQPNAYRAIPGGTAAGAWRWPPFQSSAEVIVELYVHSSSVPSFMVTGWILPLPFTRKSRVILEFVGVLRIKSPSGRILPLVCIKSHVKVFNFPHYLEKTRFNILDVHPVFPNSVPLSVFATKYVKAFLISSILSPHPAYLIVLNNTWVKSKTKKSLQLPENCALKGLLYSWPLKMGPIDCPETSVRNCHYSVRNSPERSSHLLRGGTLKSRILQLPAYPSRLQASKPNDVFQG